MADNLRVFVSHSACDADFAEAITELIKNALNLDPSTIRCTSVPGYRLPGGADTNKQLRAETLEAEAFIGLVSSSSMRSLYVAFELGARWGAEKHLVPILAPGTGAEVLDGPLKGINALRSDNRSDLHQLIDELADHLAIRAVSAASYDRYIDRVLNLPKAAIANGEPPAPRRTVLFSSLQAQLCGFPSEQNKLRYIEERLDDLPSHEHFAKVFPLLLQLNSDTGRLDTLKLIRSKLNSPSETDLHQLQSLFDSEDSRHIAFVIATGRS